MSSIPELITEYNNLGRDNDRKRDVLFELKGNPSAEVARFLRCVAGRRDEWDVIRVEALQDLANNEYSNPSDDGTIATALAELLENVTASRLVRQHAALAISPFLKNQPLFSTVKKLLLDPLEDVDVRCNLIGEIQAAGKSEPSISVVKALINDRKLGTTASRILAEWM